MAAKKKPNRARSGPEREKPGCQSFSTASPTGRSTFPDDSGQNRDDRVRLGFPVVGIGASAGGLDAFKKFFKAMPADCGMAFVLVPHLDPKHDSLMVELLARQTAMPVVEAGEGQLDRSQSCLYHSSQ